MTGVSYCTRENVKRALDSAETARNNTLVDRAIASSSRAIEGPALLNRRFYPEVVTLSFDWPYINQGSYSWRLWLGERELISVTSLTSGGVSLTQNTDYFLEPVNEGPPYDRIDINLSSSKTFSIDETYQRSISIVGVRGYNLDSVSAGTVSEALDASETEIQISDSSLIGVGSLIKIDSERMIVTGKSMLDSGQNTTGSLSESKAVSTVPVADGSLFFVDETILIDAERMLIVDIAGNNLIVRRGYDGSALAAHSTNADVYAPRSLVVTRGALGTTAATHSSGTAISLHEYPALVSELCEAESLTRLLDKGAGYARTAGSHDNARELRGLALQDLRKQAKAAYGRRDPYRGAV